MKISYGDEKSANLTRINLNCKCQARAVSELSFSNLRGIGRDPLRLTYENRVCQILCFCPK